MTEVQKALSEVRKSQLAREEKIFIMIFLICAFTFVIFVLLLVTDS
jgi:hypothetical protein